MEKYRVTLAAEERAELEHLVSVGKAAARRLTHARILLLADTATGTGYTDEDVVAAPAGHRPADGRTGPQASGHRRVPRCFGPQAATPSPGQDQGQGRLGAEN